MVIAAPRNASQAQVDRTSTATSDEHDDASRSTPSNPKTFKARDEWMRAVLAAGLPPAAALVAVRIALHLHVDSGKCVPGYVTLASELRMSKRTIIRTVATLEHRGWIAVARDGWHHANRFILMTRGDRATSPLRGDKTLSPQSAPDVTNSVVRGDKPGHSEVTHGVTHKAKRKAKRKAEESDSPAPIGSRGVKRDSRANRRTPESSFDRFWSSYPKRVAKEAARKAFTKVIENGADPELLVKGAQRYAIERADEEPRYTKHATTWLNGGCWEDESPGGAAVIDQSGNVVEIERPQQRGRRSAYDVAMEIIAMDETAGRKW